MTPTFVILDDDPTGTQAVADVPVVTVANPAVLQWAFETSPRGFFVLTNSRSLDEWTMRETIRSTVIEVLYAAAGRPVVFVSRSDSTLRGHIVAEPEAIRSGIHALGLPVPPTTVLVPAFPRAGRVTRGGVHLLHGPDGEQPAHLSHYATDATFGYSTSYLPDLVIDRSSGALTPQDVVVATPDRIDDALREQVPWIVGDAEDDADLQAIVAATAAVDPDGAQVIWRVSPGILPALLGLPASDEMPHVGEPPHHGGLVIVGSHVAQTTRQLERLLVDPDTALLTLDVDALIDVDDAHIDEIVAPLVSEAVDALATRHVVIATERTLRSWDDPERSLAFARTVSSALVAVTRAVCARYPVEFVVAKGGITSSDIVTRALGVERAMVRGRVGAGIVWEPVDGRSRPPVALVPGNIGDDDGLVDAVRGLSYQRSAQQPSVQQ
ncbi:four-carbon acid sugar kinase family protein [Microbacterium sp. 1.5R]|uniref:four-carbon acid sugar kinase family protein n=1 Tax=Microbacterium sp. 1.5R TaxID=1916917 RepID=UPI0011A7D581|nr:four-carbon acid sugar kinase family protein [Microbacterium sp. 1.5R]